MIVSFLIVSMANRNLALRIAAHTLSRHAASTANRPLARTLVRLARTSRGMRAATKPNIVQLERSIRATRKLFVLVKRDTENPPSVDDIEDVIKDGAAVDARDNVRRTPLLQACIKGHLDAVKVLLRYGAKVNDRDMYGRIALLWAAIEGHTDIVRLLLVNGSDVNVQSFCGKTALMGAAIEGHTDIVRLLLAKGATVNTVVLPLFANTNVCELSEQNVLVLLNFARKDDPKLSNS